MHYLKRTIQKKGEEAVSPVVGVMLMLVVTIIIAAVVSGFAGGLVTGTQKSPTLSMNVKIVNTGSYIGSGFSASVLSVSQPIPSSQVKLVTSWTTTMKNNQSADIANTAYANYATGSIITGGNTSLPNSANVFVYQGMQTKAVTSWATAPFAMGTDINQTNPTDPISNPTSSSYASAQSGWFGKYALQQGVNLFAYPYGSKSGMAIGGVAGNADSSGYNGYTLYAYTSGSDYTSGQIDATQAVLGNGWEQLRAGDIVHVKMIYTPTGTTIFSQDVPVTEA